MQGVALVGVFLRISPFAGRAGMDREELLAAVRERLGRFFGKRGGSVVDANLEVIAEAYDGLIDVTAAIGASPGQAGAAAIGAPRLAARGGASPVASPSAGPVLEGAPR